MKVNKRKVIFEQCVQLFVRMLLLFLALFLRGYLVKIFCGFFKNYYLPFAFGCDLNYGKRLISGNKYPTQPYSITQPYSSPALPFPSIFLFYNSQISPNVNISFLVFTVFLESMQEFVDVWVYLLVFYRLQIERGD